MQLVDWQADDYDPAGVEDRYETRLHANIGYNPWEGL